jgi:type II secretory pathway pseudopilin PulG
MMPHLAPSVGATWVDDAGWHYRAATPFPGADLLGGEQAVVTTVAPAALAVALPAAAKARQQARTVQSLSNLRQIALTIQLYANDHDGKLPPDLGATYSYVGTPTVFLAAEHAGAVELPKASANAAQTAQWINANTDYVYVGAKYGKYANVANAPETIFAHEKFDLARNGMVVVGYADGHASVEPVAVVKQRVEDQARNADGVPQGL